MKQANIDRLDELQILFKDEDTFMCAIENMISQNLHKQAVSMMAHVSDEDWRRWYYGAEE